MVVYTPDRGDLIWLNFTPQTGHEQSGHSPALVLSPKSYNQKTGLLLACPITSKIKHYPFEVVVSGPQLQGAVLADQIKSLDWRERQATYIAPCSPSVLKQVMQLVATLING